MTVDFGEDEPYAVEGLLIYLYTLEYPNRWSLKFGDPPPKAKPTTAKLTKEKSTRPSSAGGRIRLSTSITTSPSDTFKAQNEIATGSAVFELKTQAPLEFWRERLALYRIARRMDLKQLCRTCLGIMSKEVDGALRSANAAEYIREVYHFEQDEARGLKKEIATKVAQGEPCIVPQPELDALLLSLPMFGCDLIMAMQQKEKKMKERTAALQVVIDRQGKSIIDHNQGVKLNVHQAVLSRHKVELDGEKQKSKALRAKATQVRKELAENKQRATAQGKDMAKCKREISELRKQAECKTVGSRPYQKKPEPASAVRSASSSASKFASSPTTKFGSEPGSEPGSESGSLELGN